MVDTTTQCSGSDFELLAAWRGGDRYAGNQLFARHFASVYGFFRGKLGELAEDLTQQTFLRCLEGCARFRTDASFRTYLFAIARNLLYGHLRHRSRSPEIDPEINSLMDRGASSIAVLELREDHDLLTHAMRRLPVDLHAAVELYYFRRMRGQQLVAVLGVPGGTVRSRIRRGLEQLGVAMAELATGPREHRPTRSSSYR